MRSAGCLAAGLRPRAAAGQGGGGGEEGFWRGGVFSPDGAMLCAAWEGERGERARQEEEAGGVGGSGSGRRDAARLVLYRVPERLSAEHGFFQPLPVEEDREGKGEEGEAEALEDLEAVVQVEAGEPVLAHCWYPFMHWQDPATCCLLVAARDHPLQLWDACHGVVRAGYLAYDYAQQLVSPTAVAFDSTGEHIYACCPRSQLEIFSVERPGACVESVLLSPTRRSKQGLKGVLSCLEFAPRYSDNPHELAIGSYSRSLAVYDDRDLREATLCWPCLQFDVTCVRWNPAHSNYIYAGGRKHDRIICFDRRKHGQQLCAFDRPAQTNQRILFDLDPWGETLLTGASDGTLRAYHALTSEVIMDPVEQGCVVNSVHFHPNCAFVAACVGERHPHRQLSRLPRLATPPATPARDPRGIEVESASEGSESSSSDKGEDDSDSDSGSDSDSDINQDSDTDHNSAHLHTLQLLSFQRRFQVAIAEAVTAEAAEADRSPNLR